MSSPTISVSLSGILATSVPSITLGVPIATVCPLNSDGNKAQAFLPISLLTKSLNNLTTSIISASAIMPDGSIKTFSSLVSGEPDGSSTSEVVTVLPDGISAIQIDDDLGRIIIGSDGCQTLYKPTVTAICSTVLSPIGIPAVTVTDCDQYITFSSETLFSCAPTPTVVPLPAENGVGNGSSVSTRGPLGDSFTTRSFPSNRSSLTQDVVTDDVSTSATDGDPDDAVPTSPSQPLSVSSPTAQDSTPISTPDTMTTRFPIPPDDNPILFPRRITITRPRRSLIYSSAPADDVPMSLPRHLLPPESHPRQRQIMVLKGGVASTALVTVTPDVAMQEEMQMHMETGRPRGRSIANVDVPVPATRTTAKTFSIRDVFKAIFYGRQVDESGDLDGAIGVNGTIGITTDIDTDPDLDTEGGTKLNMTMSSVSMPLSPASTLSTSTDDTGLDASSFTTSDLSALPTDTDIPISTTVTDTDVDTSPSPTDTDTATDTDLDPTTLPSRLANLSPPQPTKYYAAPWYQFLSNTGSIPTNIKGITCRGGLEPVGSCLTPDTDGDTESCECDVEDEVWSVSSVTRTRVGTTIVGFSGGVLIEGMGTTVSVSVNSVVTTTATDVVGRFVRSVVTTMTSGDGEGEGTVYATLTSYPSVTMTLVPNSGVSDGIGVSETGDSGSSTVDATMNVGAAMPQSSPGSISMPTDTAMSMSLSISYPTDISMTESPDKPLSTLTTDLAETTDTGMNMDTMVDGTVLITSVVATETVTIPPGDDQGSFGPMPTGDIGGSFAVEGSDGIGG